MIELLLAEGMVDINEAISHVAQQIPAGARIGSGIFSWPLFSNHILMQILAAALLVWLVPRALRMRAGEDEVGRLVPRGLGNVVESLCEAIRKHVAEPNLGAYTPVFLPYLWSAFFFILTCNLLGMLPLGAIATLLFGPGVGHYVGGNANGNIYVTGMLAVLTLILMVYNGLRYHGLAYVKHFFMGPPYMAWFIALLEMAGLLFKTLALAMRLFANMIAGHMVLAALLGFVGWAARASVLGGAGVGLAVVLGSIALNFLELLVAFVQAFIFTLLTAVFIGMSVNIHHGEHEHEHGGREGHAAGAPAAAGAQAAH